MVDSEPVATTPTPGAGGPPVGGEPVGQFSGAALTRVLRVFGEPSEVFSELSTSPTWVWALILLIAVSFGLNLAIGPKVDFETTVRQAMAQRGTSGRHLDDQEILRIARTQEKVASVMRYATPATVSLVFLLLGGAYFLGLKAAGSGVEFAPVFATVLHATLPAALVSGALTIVAMAQKASFPAQDIERLLKSNVGAWLDPTTWKPLLVLASSLDVFNLWQWVLLTIGLSLVGKVSRARAATVVGVLWGMWIIGRAALATLF
jgi:hypothetical protein